MTRIDWKRKKTQKRTWNRMELALFIFPFLILLAPLGLRLSQQDTLDKRMMPLVEPNTIDCGLVTETNGSPQWNTANACEVEAVKAGKPYKLRKNSPNGRMAYGFIRTSDGQLTTIQYTRRYRLGVKDWEMIEVWRGKAEIRLKDGHEDVWMPDAEKVESTQRYWPVLGRSASAAG